MKWVSVAGLFLSASAWALTFDRTVPTAVRDQLLSDLAQVQTLSGEEASELHREIFGPRVDGAAYLQFFEARVKEVGMNTCGAESAIACTNPEFGTTRIFLSPNYVKLNLPWIAKIMVLFHEARHTEMENNYWPHERCPVPFLDGAGNPIRSIWTGANLAGQWACDTSAEGSYGTSVVLLKNIEKFCTSCSDQLRADAGRYADDQLKRVIDPSALARLSRDLR